MTQCTYLEAHTTFETRVWTHEQRPPARTAGRPPAALT